MCQERKACVRHVSLPIIFLASCQTQINKQDDIKGLWPSFNEGSSVSAVWCSYYVSFVDYYHHHHHIACIFGH